ncbi:MAG: hypothetical protein HY077_06680 [Elusimicrobia bacterium]|nr:hypothetical protein [Elusimicrobiota bacterium]
MTLRGFARLLAAFLPLAAAWPCSAADFDDFAPGAKAMGMGMAYSAVADDAYALFFNPGGPANTPYAQASASVGRQLSPVGTMSYAAMAYMRPFELINTATVGGAYMSIRQLNGGDKDELRFNYSQEIKVPQLLLTKPLKVGGDWKFLNINEGHPGSSSLFGMGLDFGVLARSNFGLSGSAVMSDLVTNVGQPRPKFNFGLAYVWHKWLTIAADTKIRQNLTDFYPGVEASFYEGMLKVRAGRGFQLDGVSQFAWGLGFNLSPLVLDFAMTLPSGGIHRPGGGFQMSASWRFGAPSFTGNFVGSAASSAQSLQSEIEKLAERKKAADEEAATAETHRQISEAELGVLEQRVKEVGEEYRGLQRKKEEAEFGLKESELDEAARKAPKRAPPIIRPPPPPKKPSWPQRHVVKPGETLRSMAKTFYGDGNLWELIYDANRDKVERGLPQEGSEFVIPKPPKP